MCCCNIRKAANFLWASKKGGELFSKAYAETIFNRFLMQSQNGVQWCETTKSQIATHCYRPQLTVYKFDSKTLATLALVHLIPSLLVWEEIKCTVHMAVSKWPINQFEPFRKSEQQVLRAYCPNIYTVSSALFWLSSFISVATLSLGVSTLVCSYLAAAVDALTQKSHL